MAIDEKKLIEAYHTLWDEIGLDNEDKICFDSHDMMLKKAFRTFHELIDDYKKLSLENKTSDWIPCSERLPIHEGEYLVTCKGKYRHFTEVLYFQHGRFLSCLCEVVAWFDAPLPEPYKGVEK